MKTLLELLLHFAFRIFHTNISARIIEEEDEPEEKNGEILEMTQPSFHNLRV